MHGMIQTEAAIIRTGLPKVPIVIWHCHIATDAGHPPGENGVLPSTDGYCEGKTRSFRGLDTPVIKSAGVVNMKGET